MIPGTMRDNHDDSARLVEVTAEDANNYSRILFLLGMEEDGDPVGEVAWLKNWAMNTGAPVVERLHLKWTADVPSKPGWYWIRHTRGGEEFWTIAEVRQFHDSLTFNSLCVFEGDGWTPVGHPVFHRCSWAGPISEPIEPPQ